MNNKNTKYFKYALGEIILVVIGILIALQINNWNEKRKLKSEEHELLSNISLSFGRKLTELESKNADRKGNIKDIEELLTIISKQEASIGEEQMLAYLRNMFIWYTINEEFSVIDMLYSSGKINSITNDSIKSKLIEWPDKMEEMLEEQRVVQDLVVHGLNPLISNYVSSANISNSFLLNAYPEATTYSSPYKNNFEGLLSDRSFESLIAQKLMYLRTNVNDTNILIDDTKMILELIKQELIN